VKQLVSHWRNFHETTRLPLEEFSWNLLFGYVSKS
jgi:hypothetical protein